MRNEKRVKNMRKKIRLVAIIALFFISIIGGFSIKYKFFGHQVAEAVNVVDTLGIINEYNPINVALKDEINLIYNKKIDLILKEKRKEIEEKLLALEKEENQRIEEAKANGKIAYLTFDDGPSLVATPKILDILDEYDIKATFFIVGYMAEKNPEILRMTYERGHTIGNHTYSHNYGYLYRSPSNLLADINKLNDVFKEILGDEFSTNLVRFPGGSFGKEKFRPYVLKAGFKFFDWNALNGDAEGINFSKERLVNRFKETAKNKKQLIVLMHDTDAKMTTTEALPEIIEYLIDQGYVFEVLDNYEKYNN